MKVALLSESLADETALRVLVAAVLKQSPRFVAPGYRARGWPNVAQLMPAVHAQAHRFEGLRLLGQLRLEALLPVAQLPGLDAQLAGDLGQRPAAGVEQLHGLLLELKVVNLGTAFGCRGHSRFSFSVSPPSVHSFGGTSFL